LRGSAQRPDVSRQLLPHAYPFGGAERLADV
jgi:hypothetical protein